MDLLFLLNQASYALGNEMATRLAEVGITPRHYCVLSNAMVEELTQIRLAERSMLDKTTMVVTLDELERQGFVTRRPSREDRRVKLVIVTPRRQGRRLARGRDRRADAARASSSRCPRIAARRSRRRSRTLVDGPRSPHRRTSSASQRPPARATLLVPN